MTTNQKYILAGIVLLVLMAKAKGTCGCSGDNQATSVSTPGEWWSYASQWSTAG